MRASGAGGKSCLRRKEWVKTYFTGRENINLKRDRTWGGGEKGTKGGTTNGKKKDKKIS